MHRRTFLSLGAVGMVGWARGVRRLSAQAQDDIPYGETRLAIAGPDEEREGSVYVPKAYKHGTPMPLLVMLHGFAGTAQRMRYAMTLGEEFGVVVIAPESREQTWGQAAPGFDADGKYISAAMRAVVGFLDIDRSHIAIGGQSDGATYAFSMGLAYGDVFNHLMIFSEGIPVPYRKQGKPRIFIGHGTSDTQMPIDRTAHRSVPQLKSEGYDVTFREYDGGHGTPTPIVREGFEWFVGRKKPA